MSEKERKELEVGKYKSAPTFEGDDNLGFFPRIIMLMSKNLQSCFFSALLVLLTWR